MNLFVRGLLLGMILWLGRSLQAADPRATKSDESGPISLADVIETKLPQWISAADEALKSGSIETKEEPTFYELARLIEMLKQDKTLRYVERQKALDAARPRLLRGHDLLRKQIARASRTFVNAQPLPAQAGGATQTTNTSPAEQGARQLIDVITSVIRPETWQDRGGEGTIRYWPMGHALVIYQSNDVHEKIGGTLGGMR